MPDPEQLPTIAGEPISVVLLAVHDEPSLAEVLDKWTTTLDKLERPYEILLVDDEDASLAGGEALAARFPRLKVLRDPDRRGVGAALRVGVAAAQYPLLFYTETGRHYQPGDLRRLLDEIDRVHVVSGFRKGQPAPGWLRVTGVLYRGLVRVLFGYPVQPSPGWLGWKEYAGRLLSRVVFGLRVGDVNCAYRLIRRHIFARIPIQSDGPFVHVEVLAKGNFLGHYMTDEVALFDRPALVNSRPSRGWLADALRVFFAPDFGPTVLPTPADPAAEMPGERLA